MFDFIQFLKKQHLDLLLIKNCTRIKDKGIYIIMENNILFFYRSIQKEKKLIFEFNPEIPQIVSTWDKEATNSNSDINIFPNPIQKESKLSYSS